MATMIVGPTLSFKLDAKFEEEAKLKLRHLCVTLNLACLNSLQKILLVFPSVSNKGASNLRYLFG